MKSIVPSVCIAVPVLNEAPFIRESMDSLISQDYERIEVVVIDGGSTDGTLEILRSYPIEVNVLPGLGQMAAINLAWQRSTADFVGWWAGDDRLKPGAISRLAGELERHPEAGFVHADGEIIDETGQVIKTLRPGPLHFADLLTAFGIVPQSTLIRRSALLRSGMMDDRRRLCADWDLFLRLAQYFAIAYVPFVAAQRRIHSGSEDAKHVASIGFAVREVLADFFARPDLTIEQRSFFDYSSAVADLYVGWAYATSGRRRLAAFELISALRSAPSSLWKSPTGWRLIARLCLPFRIEPNRWFRFGR